MVLSIESKLGLKEDSDAEETREADSKKAPIKGKEILDFLGYFYIY